MTNNEDSMSRQHTPGPWHVEPSPDRVHFDIRADGVHVPHGSGKGEANARLIAAAPDLLRLAREAAENAAIVADLLATPGEASKAELVSVITALGARARAAIAKAEG
jgi:hypothetical protein